MIGLTNLPDGAHTLQHPLGPVWLLVRKGRVVRAELWDTRLQRFSTFPSNLTRSWRLNAGVAAAELREEVRLAD